LLKIEDDVFTVFKQFKVLVEKRTRRSIKILIVDNEGEYTSMEFENYCKEAGTKKNETTTYTPHQNVVVECMNKSILERERSMLNNSKLQNDLWVEAVYTSCYLVN
jgi:transposase InsO family protein